MFPGMSAYDLPMDEFETRFNVTVEIEHRRAGDNSPLDAHLKTMSDMMKKWSRRQRRKKTNGKA